MLGGFKFVQKDKFLLVIAVLKILNKSIKEPTLNS